MRVFALPALLITLALSTLSACTDVGWYPRGTHTLVPQGARPTWPDSVQRAADAWSDLLEAQCGRRVFVVAEANRIADSDEHPIQLVPIERWDQPGLAAYIDGRIIRVKDGGYDDLTEQRIIQHELGHGLGAGHVDDRPSIMNDSVGSDITSEDVDMIAGLVGCD